VVWKIIKRRTLLGGSVIDVEVKVVCLTKVIDENDFFLKIKHRDSGTIECYTRLILLRFESVEHTRGHELLQRSSSSSKLEQTEPCVMTPLTKPSKVAFLFLHLQVRVGKKRMAQSSGSATTNGELRQRKAAADSPAETATTTSEEGRKTDKLLDQHQE